MWVQWNSSPYNILDNTDSTSAVELDTWTHVAAVYNHNIGGFIYLNGIMERFKSISESEDGNIPADPSVLYLGGKEGHYHFHGVLDEIKLFYQHLSSSGKIFITSNYRQYDFSITWWALLYQALLSVYEQISIRVDDWTAEWAIIASNAVQEPLPTIHLFHLVFFSNIPSNSMNWTLLQKCGLHTWSHDELQ